VIISVVVAGTALATLAMILFLALRLGPESLRIRASVTRWIFLDVELTSPTAVKHRPCRQPPGHREN